jgi:hypothetical protein
MCRYSTLLPAAILFFTLLRASAGDDTGKPEMETIRFKGRSIDIRSVLEAFPYDSWRWAGSAEHNVFYCLKRDGKGKYIYGLNSSTSGAKRGVIGVVGK